MEALRHLLGNVPPPQYQIMAKKSRLDSLLQRAGKSIKSNFVNTTNKKAKQDLPTGLQTPSSLFVPSVNEAIRSPLPLMW
jgi:hypothetical protein